MSRERPRRAGLRDGFRTIAPRPVQSGVSVRVRAGEALTITGQNGTGKSTLALTLAGLLRPVAGTVSATAELSSPATGHSSWSLQWPRHATAPEPIPTGGRPSS